MQSTFLAVSQYKLFSISSLCVSFVLAVRTRTCAVIQSWQAHFQSKMSCYWKQYSTRRLAADRSSWQAGVEFDMLIQFLLEVSTSLPFLRHFNSHTEQFTLNTHTLYSHTRTYSHTRSVRKAATHVVSNLIGTEEAIRQTAQGEVAPVMWNGSH